MVGSAPARRLIVQWTNVGHSSLQCTTASLSTFQIVLHETSNIIEVLHSTVRTDGGTHYVEMGALTNIITLIPYNGTLTPLGNWGVMFLPSIEGFCSSPLLAIPDSPSTGIQSDLVLPPPFPYDVSDLDVFLQIPHTWLNDLDITLTHVPSGTSVRIVDNYCGSTFYDTIGGLILDDEAGVGTCNAFPAIGATGRAQPLNPLSAFDGKKMEGTWRLTVADTNGLDVGTLMHWCLVPTLVPTAVTLLSFEGRVVGDGVELTWETASEVDVLGFNLYRSEDGVRPETPLNGELIASHSPGGGQGAMYTYADETVSTNRSYTYWLEDVAVDGTATLHEPIVVSTGVPTAVTVGAWHVAPSLLVGMVVGTGLLGLMGLVAAHRMRAGK